MRCKLCHLHKKIWINQLKTIKTMWICKYYCLLENLFDSGAVSRNLWQGYVFSYERMKRTKMLNIIISNAVLNHKLWIKITWKNNTDLGFRIASIKIDIIEKRFRLQDDPQVVWYFYFVYCRDNFSGTNRYQITTSIS